MQNPPTSNSAGLPAAAAPARVVDADWRRWIAENVLLNRDPGSIVVAMVREGYDEKTAVFEVRAALEHPYIRAGRELAKPEATNRVAGGFETKLRKRDWVLECYRRSARQTTGWGTVPRVHKPSRQAFLDDFYSTNLPVVIEGAMDDWAAVTSWTSENLKRRLGSRIVEVQANRNADANYERNESRLKRTMPFGEYIDTLDTAGTTNDWYMTANNSGKNKETIKELWDDIVMFPEYLRDDDPNNRGFFWYGPAGTITPLHHDLTNNFMAQVRGSKLVRLVPPFEWPRLYNDLHCYSKVDLANPDFERFPLFRDVTVIDVVIGPKDLLFLPVGWWHYVRGLETSITMTFTNFVFDNDFHSFYTTYSNI